MMNGHGTMNDDGFYELLEKAVEETASASELTQLERLVIEDAQARRVYVEYMHQHAGLRWHRGADHATLDAAIGAAEDEAARPARVLRRVTWLRYAAAAAVALSLGVWLGGDLLGEGEATPFATLLEVRGARWDGGTLPTEVGSRLIAGRLRLSDGLATVRFDNGATLTIEGASDLELVTGDRCVLHAGGLVANVPPAAIGFTVDTPRATVVDHGTAFGVSVDANGEGRVQVFEGEVDVEHHRERGSRRLTTGAAVRVAEAQLQHVVAGDEEGRVGSTGEAMLPAADTIRITTAQGRGRDTYIKHPLTATHDSDVLLLVKNARPQGFSRKAYMAFDIAGLKGRRVREAHLQLTMLPTGWGFAATLPDCDFEVYGVTEESLDGWPTERMDWASGPANLDDGAAMDLSRSKLLGAFRVPRGVQQGVIDVTAPELAEFLNADGNGVVTLVVVRKTREVRSGSLIHGFASSRHPTAAPPTLRVAVE